MLTLAALVDVGTLLRVVASAVVAGIGTTAVFSLGLLGATRFAELRRRGGGHAAWYAALALAGGAATIAAVTIGLVVMAKK